MYLTSDAAAAAVVGDDAADLIPPVRCYNTLMYACNIRWMMSSGPTNTVCTNRTLVMDLVTFTQLLSDSHSTVIQLKIISKCFFIFSTLYLFLTPKKSRVP